MISISQQYFFSVKNTTHIHIKIILLLSLLTWLGIQAAFSQNAGFYTGSYDDTAWNLMLDSVAHQKNILEQKVSLATTANLETSYAKGSLTTVENFICFASQDRENETVLTAYYAKFGAFENAFKAQINALGFAPVAYAEYSPFQILYLCNNVLQHAIKEVDGQLNGDIILPITQNFTVGSFPALEPGSGYYYKNNKPIFPATFWGMPAEPDLMEAIGYLGEVFLSPVTTEAPIGEVRSAYANGQISKLDSHVAANQTPTQVHITHQPLPLWMVQAHPEINDFSRGFVNYDIHNPKTYEFNKNMITGFATEINNNSNSGPLIYVLSNEPRWEIGEGRPQSNSGISQKAVEAYLNYIIAEYENIDTLNAVYNAFNGNANFTTFDEVSTTYTIPLPISLRGTPAWYDWMRFNMNSVTNWHVHLKECVRMGDPDAKTSIKIRGRDFEEPHRDHGVDIEQLMDMQEVIGFDNHTTPQETHFRLTRPYQDWLDRYSIEWREQALVLDFSKSMYPDKPTFDSEWHGISTSAWVNYSIDRNYTKAAIWLAFTNGLSLMNAWWWYRATEDRVNGTTNIMKGDIEPKASFVNNTSFGPLHQPVAFDAFGRAIKELNANSETIVTLSPEKRDYLIYYMEESAIQDAQYMPQVARIYEALKLLNYKVGFTTPNKIADNTHNPKAIIVPPARFAKDTTYLNLQNYKINNNNVQVISVNASNGQNFSLKEKGTVASRDLSFIDEAFTYNDHVESLIDSLKFTLPVSALTIPIKIKDAANAPAYGVFTNFGQTPNGDFAFSLINVSKDERHIQLPNAWTFTNKLTAEILPNEFVMQPNDVYLLEASDPCANNGADTDFDGVCNPQDICANGDDNEDNNMDGIPDACYVCKDIVIDLNSPDITYNKEANIEITTNGTIPTGSNISYHAGNYVELISGFGVELDAAFYAFIAPCD